MIGFATGSPDAPPGPPHCESAADSVTPPEIWEVLAQQLARLEVLERREAMRLVRRARRAALSAEPPGPVH